MTSDEFYDPVYDTQFDEPTRQMQQLDLDELDEPTRQMQQLDLDETIQQMQQLDLDDLDERRIFSPAPNLVSDWSSFDALTPLPPLVFTLLPEVIIESYHDSVPLSPELFQQSIDDLKDQMQVPTTSPATIASSAVRIARDSVRLMSRSLRETNDLTHQMMGVILDPSLSWKEKPSIAANLLSQRYANLSPSELRSAVWQWIRRTTVSLYGRQWVPFVAAASVMTLLWNYGFMSSWGFLFALLQSLGIWRLPTFLADKLQKILQMDRSSILFLPLTWFTKDAQRIRDAISAIRIPEDTIQRIIQIGASANTVWEGYQLTSLLYGMATTSVGLPTLALITSGAATVWLGKRSIDAIVGARTAISWEAIRKVVRLPTRLPQPVVPVEFAEAITRNIADNLTVWDNAVDVDSKDLKEVKEIPIIPVPDVVVTPNVMDPIYHPAIVNVNQAPRNERDINNWVAHETSNQLMQQVIEPGTLLFPVADEEVEVKMEKTKNVENENNIIGVLQEKLKYDARSVLDRVTQILPYAATYQRAGFHSLLVQLIISRGFQYFRVFDAHPDYARVATELNQNTPEWRVFVRRVIRTLQGGDYYTLAQLQEMDNAKFKTIAAEYGTNVRLEVYKLQHVKYLKKRAEVLRGIASGVAEQALRAWTTMNVPPVPSSEPAPPGGPRSSTPPLEEPLQSLQQRKQYVLARMQHVKEFAPFLQPEQVEEFQKAFANPSITTETFNDLEKQWSGVLQQYVQSWRTIVQQLNFNPINPELSNQVDEAMETLQFSLMSDPFSNYVIDQLVRINNDVIPSIVGQRMRAIDHVIQQIPPSMITGSTIFQGFDGWIQQWQDFRTQLGQMTYASPRQLESMVTAFQSYETQLAKWKTAWFEFVAADVKTYAPTHWSIQLLNERIQNMHVGALSDMGLAAGYAWLAAQQIKLRHAVDLARQIGVLTVPPTLAHPSSSWEEVIESIPNTEQDLEGLTYTPLLYGPLGEFVWDLGLKLGRGISSAKIIPGEFKVVEGGYDVPSLELASMTSLKAIVEQLIPTMVVPGAAEVARVARAAQMGQNVQVIGMLVNRGLQNMVWATADAEASIQQAVESSLADTLRQYGDRAVQWMFSSEANDIRNALNRLEVIDRVKSVATAVAELDFTGMMRSLGITTALREKLLSKPVIPIADMLHRLKQEAFRNHWTSEQMRNALLDELIGFSRLIRDINGGNGGNGGGAAATNKRKHRKISL